MFPVMYLWSAWCSLKIDSTPGATTTDASTPTSATSAAAPGYRAKKKRCILAKCGKLAKPSDAPAGWFCTAGALSVLIGFVFCLSVATNLRSGKRVWTACPSTAAPFKATCACVAGFWLWPALTFVLRWHWRRARRRYFDDVFAAEQRRLHDLHSWATEAEEEGVASGRGEEEKGQPVARGLEMEMAAV